MSAILFAVPLSVMIGALSIIRHGRIDRHYSALVPIWHMPINNIRPMRAGKPIGRVAKPIPDD
jgi:hypothetical protein